MLKKFALKMADTPFVRSAIEERADLSAFREKPTPLVVVGVSVIVLSFLAGWPAVAAMGVLAVKLDEPWIALVGAPLVYGLSHLLFLFGMYLSGALYSMIFFRWLARVATERMLRAGR